MPALRIFPKGLAPVTLFILMLLTSIATYGQGVTVSAASGNTSEDGTTATFLITLDTQPTASVTIELSSDDLTEGSVNASVTIPALDWNVGRTVTVTGVDDTALDGGVGFNIITGDVSSADGDYDALGGGDVADVAFVNDDNDQS